MRRLRIILIAHDDKETDLVEWTRFNAGTLCRHDLIATAATGQVIQDIPGQTDLVEWTRFNAGTLCRHDLIATAATGQVIQDIPGLTVRTLLHGPAGGDAQAGALIATGEADVLVFFWEPLEVQPHDVDVKALLRLAVLHNVPTACNRATADYLISSPLFGTCRNTMLRAAMRHAMLLRGRHGRRWNAPGANRTRDLSLRRRLLYPLSYGGRRSIYHAPGCTTHGLPRPRSGGSETGVLRAAPCRAVTVS